MTKQEVMQEFILELLKIVDSCDKDLQAAFEKRQKALAKLNEQMYKSWEEAVEEGSQ